MYYPASNFGFGTVDTAPSPATSGTSLVLSSGEGANFPDPATEGAYPITIYPASEQPSNSNAEIALVTAKSTDTLTITRQQEGTSARTVIVGDNVAMTHTADVQEKGSYANWFKVTQSSHGFSAKDAVYFNGSSWAKAQANNSTTLSSHVVVRVIDTNNVILASEGLATITSHGLTVGSTYYLSSSSAGTLTATKPDTYANPVLIPTDANTVMVFPKTAPQLADPTLIPISTIPTRQADNDPNYTLRFAADMTGILTPGMRIKIIQGTTKWGIVVYVGAFTGGNTDVIIFCGTGGSSYDISDTGTTAITAIWYSPHRFPTGFDADPDIWKVENTNTSDSTQSSPTANTWYNDSNDVIDIPIGKWVVKYEVALQINNSGTTTGQGYSTLSTANNSEIDKRYSAVVQLQAPTGALAIKSNVSKQFNLDLSAADTYYLNKMSTVNATAIEFKGAQSTTVITATSAYL